MPTVYPLTFSVVRGRDEMGRYAARFVHLVSLFTHPELLVFKMKEGSLCGQ